MKYLGPFIILLFCSFFTSCNSLTSGNVALSVLIDGELFESSFAAGASTSVGGQQTLAINAPASNLSLSASALFVDKNSFEPGSYSLDLNQGEAGFTYTQNVSDPKTTYTSNNGIIIITVKDSIAKQVIGTFSGSMVNIEDDTLILDFTEGEFNITYIE